MTEISERYRKLAQAMTERIAAVPEDGWSSPTPCPDWTARDLVRHLVDSPGIFFGMIEHPAPSGGPSLDDDPVGAFTHVRDAVQAALEDPAIAQTPYEGFFGPSTFEQGIAQFICADLVIHAWDLARATGQDEQLDAGEVSALYDAMLPMDDAIRAPGAFGPKVEPPPDADTQTQLLSFLGREV